MSHVARRSQSHRCSDGLEVLFCSQPKLFGDEHEPLVRVRRSKAECSGARRPLVRCHFLCGSRQSQVHGHATSSLQPCVSSKTEIMIWSELSPWLGRQKYLRQCEYKYLARYEVRYKCERLLLILYKQRRRSGKREIHGDVGATGVLKNTCNLDAQLH